MGSVRRVGRRWRSIVAGLAALLLVTSCGGGDGLTGPIITNIDAARSLWLNNQPSSYSFELALMNGAWVPSSDFHPVTVVDGQVVTAKGSGYTASSSLGMIQCVAGADSIDDCDGLTATSFSADANGRFQKAFTVRRVISHNVDQHTDCAAQAGACVVASVYIHGFQGLATARLVFDG